MDNANWQDRSHLESLAATSDLTDRRRSTNRRAEDLRRLAGGATQWSLRDLYSPLFRFRKRAFFFFLAVMVAVTVGLLTSQRKYQSEAWLFVRLGRESVALDPTATAGTTGTVAAGLSVTREAEINSIIEVMGSRAIMEKVVDEVGLEIPVTSDLERDEAISKLRREVSIWSPKNTSVIGVSCRAPSPERAQKIVSALVEIYQKEHLRLNSTAGSREFFDEQSKLLKRQLDDAVATLRDAKISFGLATVEGRRDALQRQLNGVETQSLETASALVASAAKLKDVQTTLASLPDRFLVEFSGPHETSSSLRQKFYDLQTREQELLAKYTDDHPSVVAIRREVLAAEEILTIEQPNRTQSTDAALLAEQSNFSSLQARARALREQHGRLQDDLRVLSEQEVKIGELDRRVKVSESSYLTYMANQEQARISEALKQQAISNLNVVQPANLGLKPVSPRIGLTLALALLAATAGAFGVVLLSEHLDNSLKTPEDVERYLGLPLLVSVPRTHFEQLTAKDLN